MSTIEIIGAVIGLIYLILEYKANVWLWPVGIIMSLFYVVIFLNGKFYADAMLNVYYIGANVYGLAVWTMSQRKKKKYSEIVEKTEEMKITHTPKKRVVPIILTTLVLWFSFCVILKRFTDSPIPIGDSFTTALSIVAMWMLAHKYIEQWLFWIIVNIVSVILYFWKGLYPTGILYIVYVIVATMGFFEWRKRMINDSSKNV